VEFEEELQVFKQRACVWFWGLNDSQGVDTREGTGGGRAAATCCLKLQLVDAVMEAGSANRAGTSEGVGKVF
jgi:hypothetical protein